MKRRVEDLEIEFVQVDLDQDEREIRLCALVKALLEIDEILKAREIERPSLKEAA